MITVKRTNVTVEGDKRQYAPYETTWVCPDCGVTNHEDHAEECFAYPKFGEVNDVYLFCKSCDDAGKEGDKGLAKVKVDIVVMLHNETFITISKDQAKLCVETIHLLDGVVSGTAKEALVSLMNKLTDV